MVNPLANRLISLFDTSPSPGGSVAGAIFLVLAKSEERKDFVEKCSSQARHETPRKDAGFPQFA
jgi:hypothetical protein